MRFRVECFPCIARQALRVAERSTADVALRLRIVKEVLRRVSEDPLDRSPAEVSLVVYTAARELSGVEDPFLASKDEQNAAALAMYPELLGRVRASSDPLRTAAMMAVAGNAIDLGVGLAFDARDEIEKVLRESFAIDHYDAFAAELGAASTVLYLCDNCGEIVFDKIFMEAMRAARPGLELTAVVKEGPAINDVTLREAKHVGLGEVARVISCGGAYIGTPLRAVSPAVRSLLRSSDIVVAKGHGNYETADALPRAIYFLLKAKCPCVAENLGVALGDVVFARGVGAGSWQDP